MQYPTWQSDAVFTDSLPVKTTLLVCGKLSHGYLAEGVSHYLNKLKHYGGYELVELNLKKNQAAGLPEMQREAESALFMNRVKAEDLMVLLDERGKQIDSLKFAGFIQSHRNSSRRPLVFCIGGSFGFSPRMYARANHLLSFSQFTFNHQLFRLMVLEQLYRAESILRNEPYHHAGTGYKEF